VEQCIEAILDVGACDEVAEGVECVLGFWVHRHASSRGIRSPLSSAVQPCAARDSSPLQEIRKPCSTRMQAQAASKSEGSESEFSLPGRYSCTFVR
jgi:hypothetical protein